MSILICRIRKAVVMALFIALAFIIFAPASTATSEEVVVVAE